MNNSLGLYAHKKAFGILGRTTNISFNNQVKVVKNTVIPRTKEELERIGWINIAPVVLAGWHYD